MSDPLLGSAMKVAGKRPADKLFPFRALLHGHDLQNTIGGSVDRVAHGLFAAILERIGRLAMPLAVCRSG
jgi:hypothetical protein